VPLSRQLSPINTLHVIYLENYTKQWRIQELAEGGLEGIWGDGPQVRGSGGRAPSGRAGGRAGGLGGKLKPKTFLDDSREVFSDVEGGTRGGCGELAPRYGGLGAAPPARAHRLGVWGFQSEGLGALV